MHSLFEGARTIKPGQKLLRELFKGAVFSRARSDQGNTVSTKILRKSMHPRLKEVEVDEKHKPLFNRNFVRHNLIVLR